jgi:hypothetical protein
MEGFIALLLFLLFLWEWPQFLRGLEARSASNPDPIVARIRMARIKAGLPPEPED